MPVYADPTDGRRLSPAALRSWTEQVVEWIGTPQDIAADVAEILVASDRRGIASHGTARLPSYLALVEAGVMDPTARPVHDGGRPALGRFDARNGWGHHAGRVALDWAIDAAGHLGIATAVVAHTNHYGIAGWYALRAAAAGMIGFSLSNTSPLVAPTRRRCITPSGNMARSAPVSVLKSSTRPTQRSPGASGCFTRRGLPPTSGCVTTSELMRSAWIFSRGHVPPTCLKA
jgi:hypothetical protein